MVSIGISLAGTILTWLRRFVWDDCSHGKMGNAQLRAQPQAISYRINYLYINVFIESKYIRIHNDHRHAIRPEFSQSDEKGKSARSQSRK